MKNDTSHFGSNVANSNGVRCTCRLYGTPSRSTKVTLTYGSLKPLLSIASKSLAPTTRTCRNTPRKKCTCRITTRNVPPCTPPRTFFRASCFFRTFTSRFDGSPIAKSRRALTSFTSSRARLPRHEDCKRVAAAVSESSSSPGPARRRWRLRKLLCTNLAAFSSRSAAVSARRRNAPNRPRPESSCPSTVGSSSESHSESFSPGGR
mmetsp:Transcript_10457/g.43854  ORF Transcript_10457/g.43854 Transcript_10457/m.43854 type:complete len:206 (-) Transcript_10457:160-777(-)